MKQECPTYLKTIGKSKTLVATLSDTELEDELDDNDVDGILNALLPQWILLRDCRRSR